MLSNQGAPRVQVGLFADLPNPAEIPLGYFFFATDTIQLFLLKIDPVTQARTWVQVVSGATPLGIPLDQIAFGNATGGLQSSPHLTFDPVGGVFLVRDTNGVILFTIDALAANRLFEVMNAQGFSAFMVDGKAASQSVKFNDSNGVTMENVDERAAVRQLIVQDATGAPISVIDTLTGSGHRSETWTDGTQPVFNVVTDPAARGALDNTGRGAHLYDAGGLLRYAFRSDNFAGPNIFLQRGFGESGAILFEQFQGPLVWSTTWSEQTGTHAIVAIIQSSAGARTQFLDVGGASILNIGQVVATKSATWSIPETLASFTVAALPSPPNGGAGSMAWASNARVGVETGGNGTGAHVTYKTSGSAGAGWYVTATLFLGGTPALAAA